MDITRDFVCLSEFTATELDTILQERTEMLLSFSDLLLMKIQPEVLNMWVDPENIEDFVSNSWTDVSVSSPCRNISVTIEELNLEKNIM